MRIPIRWNGVVREWGLVASVLALGACAPLAQAPLVYSSKVSGGVDLSATSTETPGISLSIGYKAVDAAYVPVAVSQQCMFRDSSVKDCDPSKLKISLISSQTNFSNTAAPSADQLRIAAFRLSEAEALRDERVSAYNARLAERDDAQRVAAEAAAADSDLMTLQSANPIDQAAIDAARQRSARASEASSRLPDLNKAVEKAAADKAAAEGAVAAASATKTTLESELERSTANRRGDAFSVFGSFTSDTRATSAAGKADPTLKTEATLGLGKVFSTGLASQNLTEGIRSAQTTNCYAAASKAAEIINGTTLAADEKSRQISDLYRSCGSSAPKG